MKQRGQEIARGCARPLNKEMVYVERSRWCSRRDAVYCWSSSYSDKYRPIALPRLALAA
jgi:hypothetical protein